LITPDLSSSTPYDVVIAGASFAGLAAAQALAARKEARILLIDREPIGDGVTSACAAPVRVVGALGGERSILAEHATLEIHTPGSRVSWPLPEPFCTFDYTRLCLDAATVAGVGSGRTEFRLGSVQGRTGDVVQTSLGPIAARQMIDATGPRAALAGPRTPRYVAFGIESEIPHRVEPGLHFYFVPEIRDGYAWAFTCGATTRFGVLSYRGRTKLSGALEQFMARFGARPGPRHGGYLATGWSDTVADDVFVTGDAAGHCLPVSGEGIRTAVLAGFECGALVRQVLDGTLTEANAARQYRVFVAEERRRYRALLWANLFVLKVPQPLLGPAARALAHPVLLRWFFRHYLGIFGAGYALAGREPRAAIAREC
jgi:digeranylgeranylglycerophospholipid reductase